MTINLKILGLFNWTKSVEKAKIGLEPILKDLQSNTLTNLRHLA